MNGVCALNGEVCCIRIIKPLMEYRMMPITTVVNFKYKRKMFYVTKFEIEIGQ